MPSNAPRANTGAAWNDKILAQIPDRRNHAKFWQEGLNTGVRVLGIGACIPHIDEKQIADNMGNRGRTLGYQIATRLTQPGRTIATASTSPT